MLNANFHQTVGSIRRLNGVNIGPRFNVRRNTRDRDARLWEDLKIPITRLHDIPWLNPAMNLVDIHQIFPIAKADEHNPDNYDFRMTDDYIKLCRELHCDVLYRLGESIEHSFDNYHIFPPENLDKWITICTNVIRHYNEGWNRGFGFGIKYWEIWNEPDLGYGYTWTGSNQQFFELFAKAARALKCRFPQLKIGGPALAKCKFPGDAESYQERFLAYCRDHEVPLDFFSFHRYSKDPEEMIALPGQVKQLLENYGYGSTEIFLDEWHYMNADWGRLADSDYAWQAYEGPDGVSGIDGAAYAATLLIAWQDTPLRQSCYYTAGNDCWGLFDQYYKPRKTYYAYKAFAMMLEVEKERCFTQNDKQIKLLAGRKDGRGMLLISAFDDASEQLEFVIDGALPGELSVQILDREHDLVQLPSLNFDGVRLIVNKPPGSAIFLIKDFHISPENNESKPN